MPFLVLELFSLWTVFFCSSCYSVVSWLWLVCCAILVFVWTGILCSMHELLTTLCNAKACTLTSSIVLCWLFFSGMSCRCGHQPADRKFKTHCSTVLLCWTLFTHTTGCNRVVKRPIHSVWYSIITKHFIHNLTLGQFQCHNTLINIVQNRMVTIQCTIVQYMIQIYISRTSVM